MRLGYPLPPAHMLGCVLLACVGFASMAVAAPREVKVHNDTAGDVTILAPKSDPELFALFISDRDGLTPARQHEAEELVAHGAAVALIDLPSLMKRTNESDDKDCHYTFGDFEDISRSAERQLGMTNWRWPVMIGIGDGGTLAYIATAQAPENTAAGGISIGIQPSFASRLPMCGMKELKQEDGRHTYAPSTQIPGHWTLIAAEQPAPEIAAFTSAAPTAKLHIAEGGVSRQFDAAIQEAFDMGGPPPAPVADLPLVEVTPKGNIQGLAIFISGDGGWRDIDKQIAEYLSERGIGIVGVDSLRYFWRRKEPQQIASDMTKVMAYYTKLWQVRRVSLLGYSIGANVIPFLWDKFDKKTQSAIHSMVLLGLEPTSDFEVTVQGWLGMPSAAQLDVRPQLALLPRSKVMCFYGIDEKDENDTACIYPELSGAEIIQRPGGHHFDGNYQVVARMIYERLTARVSG